VLHVWLRGQHSPLLLWQAAQKTWQEYADWQQVRDATSEQSVCLYFPSQYVQQLQTELTPTQLKQLGETGKQYLFEEISLIPAEQLSIREIHNGPSNQPLTAPLYATGRNDIAAWLQSAQLGNFSIVALLPDFLLLPVPVDGIGQQLNLYQDRHTTLIRQSEVQGMAVSYLPLVIERLPHLSEICVIAAVDAVIDSDNDNMDAVAASLAALKNSLPEQASADIILTPLAVSPMPVANAERHSLNFYAKPSSLKLSPYLKVTMMVAVAALVFQLSADALQWYHYKQATAATKQATAAQYQAWFPEERLSPKNSIQLSLEPKLTTNNAAESQHIALLNRIAPLIKQSALTAQALEIEPTTLSFTVVGDNRDSLDKFASTLSAQGIEASLGSVNNSEQDKVAGQVTVNITPPPT